MSVCVCGGGGGGGMIAVNEGNSKQWKVGRGGVGGGRREGGGRGRGDGQQVMTEVITNR